METEHVSRSEKAESTYHRECLEKRKREKRFWTKSWVVKGLQRRKHVWCPLTFQKSTLPAVDQLLCKTRIYIDPNLKPCLDYFFLFVGSTGQGLLSCETFGNQIMFHNLISGTEIQTIDNLSREKKFPKVLNLETLKQRCGQL